MLLPCYMHSYTPFVLLPLGGSRHLDQLLSAYNQPTIYYNSNPLEVDFTV